MQTLTVNPASIRPTWPLAVTYDEDERVGPFQDAVAMAFDVEGLDTEEDLDVAVTDGDGRPAQAVILEPGWCAVLHVAHGEQKFSAVDLPDGRVVSAEYFGGVCTRAVVIDRDPSRVGESFPSSWDKETVIAVCEHSTPLAAAEFRRAWFKGIWTRKSR